VGAAIVIDGFTPDDKVPGFVSQRTFGGGRQAIGSIPLKCSCMGNKTSGGTAAVSSYLAASTAEQAAALWGARSELANMAYAAFEVSNSVTFWGLCVAEASGAAATLTYTFTGTTATAGSSIFQIDHVIFTVNFAASDTTPTLKAVAFVNAVNGLQNGQLFASAANTAGVVTVTCANIGVRGNQHTGWIVDTAAAPTSMGVTMTGGTPLSNGGVPFTGGSGADDVTAALTATDTLQLDYIAVAQNDATNMGVVETHVNSKAAFDVGLLDVYITAGNGTQAAAIAIGQTQMNDPLGQFVWTPLGVEHPSRVAARMAALRSTTEGAQPNTNYNGKVLKGAAPHFQRTDSPGRSTKKAALNAGLTIMETVDSKLQIVRAISSHSLNGSTPDYRNLDVSDTVVPIRITKELAADYAQTLVDNPYAGPDTSAEDMPKAGVLTPNLWKHIVTARMKTWEDPEQGFNWVTAVDANPTVTVWDDTAQRVMAATPVIVKPKNNALGQKINQTAA
jgi:phage tail sheath gpL-like